MSAADRLKEALEKTGIPVKYYEYRGTAPEYVVYNEEDERCVHYSDDYPGMVYTQWQVHLFSPETYDFRARKREIRRLLLEDGFGVGAVKTLFETETKTVHVVLSCNILENLED